MPLPLPLAWDSDTSLEAQWGPGAPLWVFARRMKIHGKEIDFYLFLITKENYF